MIKSLFACALAVSAVACTKPTDPMPTSTSSTGRVAVERIGVFADGLAYGERRGIYVVTDNENGREFIGISGVGIAETGSHPAGKTRMTDER
ncbi:MAG: hypothetical protein DI555_06480 [Novosphingobium pentaromativorans]|uniref:Uncharacterized protein n=1 Tax=Novosphingobium pentaromativorans TaxID=205844 RepID=A0A2W5NS49_9SPHN|nr:MAG: hypothetical protein DI555_06480 [Novosphingobium pentaromativorans]